MSAELSGIVSGLSGRVETLYNSYTYLNQQILLKPDPESFEDFQVSWNSQFNQINSSVNKLKSQISSVQNLLLNLNISLANLQAAFTGHTGRILTGTNAAHGGIP